MKTQLTPRLGILICSILFLSISLSTAQVGIGTVTPDGVLDLNSDVEKNVPMGTNTYGLVLPRVVLSRTDVATIVDPATSAPLDASHVGTVVYNTVTTSFGRNSVYPGIYMWDGIEWINEFPKKDAAIYKQDNSAGALRTITNFAGNYQNIPGLLNQTFTPTYSGTYKIELSMNWGGGQVDNLGTGTDVAVMTGNFNFTFDGVDELFPAHTWSGRHGGGTNYYDIWEQFTVVRYQELVAGTDYLFSLRFDQTVADGFIDGGNTVAGRGWLGGDIPCTIEFVFLD